METKIIKLYDVVGGRAVDMEQGDIVFELINQELRNDNCVTLDFNNMISVLSAFLNNAIGQLYKEYTSDFLNDHLNFRNLTHDYKNIIVRVLKNAKEYYSNPELITQRLNDAYQD